MIEGAGILNPQRTGHDFTPTTERDDAAILDLTPIFDARIGMCCGLGNFFEDRRLIVNVAQPAFCDTEKGESSEAMPVSG